MVGVSTVIKDDIAGGARSATGKTGREGIAGWNLSVSRWDPMGVFMFVAMAGRLRNFEIALFPLR